MGGGGARGMRGEGRVKDVRGFNSLSFSLVQYSSAVGQAYGWAYFLLVIFLGSVFLLNMLTGVLTM